MKERAFFERIAIPHILFSNKDGNIKAELVSDSLCSIVGIDRDSILNSAMRLIHPDDAECLSVSFRRFIDDHSSLDVMIRVFDKNINSYKLMHGEGLWQLLEDGMPFHLLLQIWEIDSGSRFNPAPIHFNRVYYIKAILQKPKSDLYDIFFKCCNKLRSIDTIFLVHTPWSLPFSFYTVNYRHQFV